MNKLLIISFDLIRNGEHHKSLAISSLLAYMKQNIRYGSSFTIEHLPINMFGLNSQSTAADLKPDLSRFDISSFDQIAISAYVWNEYLTNQLMELLRKDFGFVGDFILGGYQISYSDAPKKEYPHAKYFVSGYAEESLLQIATHTNNSTHLNAPIDFSTIPSPYLTGELPINQQQKMVRLETKRGCPYRCTFCAHRDLTLNKVYKHNLDKIHQELAFFKDKQVGKINIIDPIFNSGREYLSIMDEMVRIDLKSLVSMQARFETITGDKGKYFLDQCEKLNIHLEFGLQTASPTESKLISRKNNPDKIKSVMEQLNARGISYEISLIYGLPTQTLDSFNESIDFALDNGCTQLTAFPLMLLKGTELYAQKEQYQFREQHIGEYNIPVTVASNSYSEKEWYNMRALAHQLQENHRI